MILIICTIFFVSGMAALVFEALWFHITGLVFGNSVWATSLVLSSFMAGIATGNGLVAFRGDRIKNFLYFYAFLEAIVAISGIALVFALPHLTESLVPAYHFFQGDVVLLNALRALLAFLFMVIPTSAMGMTLPILVKALYAKDVSFGRVLGRLYGWNTLGAMVGVLTCELFWIKWFGIKGTAVFAAGLDVLAALAAIWYAWATKDETLPDTASRQKSRTYSGHTFRIIRLLCASFLSGFTLLALEVLWFRFLLLFIGPTGWSFAVMLAMVLAGISLGGLLASKGFGWYSNFHYSLFTIGLINGILLVVLYANFAFIYKVFEGYRMNIQVIGVSFFLIFPVSLISGMIFTMLGKALHRELTFEAKATGLLTLANTIGGTIGALVSSLVLIPVFGVETSFFGLALFYGLIAVLVLRKEQFIPFTKPAFYQALMIAAYTITVLLFPFGFMNFHYLAIPLARYEQYGEQRVGVKEGLTETIQYLRKDFLHTPHYYRLLTNNHSMSATTLNAKRYMSYFVHLPVAIHANMKRSLLICFGCGITAKALTNTKSLEHIDVVDISQDIIEASQLVFPDPQENPIYDPRMNIHIEDGRFFLLTTEHQFDLITAEPPPPAHSGVENLYSQEYFQLIHDRLAEGGIVTYWLPVYQLSVSESKSILKGFCNVFESCTLWSGSSLEWMMMGIKHPLPPVTQEEFGKQWQDPLVQPELLAVGFENPEQFGAFFIADSKRLENWLRDSSPLTDNYPQRLSSWVWNHPIDIKTYLDFMDTAASQKNFLESEDIAQIWPESLRQTTIKQFAARQMINEILARSTWRNPLRMFHLHECLQNPSLNHYILWLLDSDDYAQQILANVLQETPENVFQDIEAYPHLAARALQENDYLLAERYLQRLTDLNIRTDRDESLFLNFYTIRMYLLYLSGEKQQAFDLGQEYIQYKALDKEQGTQEIEAYWNWLTDVLGEKDVENGQEDFSGGEEIGVGSTVE